MFNTVDFNKAHTSNFQDIKYFPVFTIFDLWKKYDNHNVDDYYQYIAEYKTAYNNHEYEILFRKKYSRCYGYKLNRINKEYYKILQYRKPSKLNETNSRDQIQLLYNFNELNECFNPIFDFIYDMMLYKLYVTYKKIN